MGLLCQIFAPKESISWCILRFFGISPIHARALAKPSCMAWQTCARISAAYATDIVMLDVVGSEASPNSPSFCARSPFLFPIAPLSYTIPLQIQNNTNLVCL